MVTKMPNIRADVLKPVLFVVSIDDIKEENFTYDEQIGIKQRLAMGYSFGTNFDTAITIFPKVIGNQFKNDIEKIIRKINYTVVHELSHNLCVGLFDNEDYAHTCSMILLQDSKSNLSGRGHGLMSQLLYHGKIEVEIEGDGEEEAKIAEEPRIEAQTPNKAYTTPWTIEEARESSRKRLAGKHTVIG